MVLRCGPFAGISFHEGDCIRGAMDRLATPDVWRITPRRSASRGLCAHRPPLLEAFAAENRAALGRPEGHRRLLTTLRTGRLGFRASGRRPAGALGTLRFAGLTTLGLVLEAFVGEEHLFASGEDELGAAIRALQDLIVIFHAQLPCPGSGIERAHLARGNERRGRTDRPGGPGTDPTGVRARSCDSNPKSSA